ncbi:diguanylate cyclase [Ensifer canadensis]
MSFLPALSIISLLVMLPVLLSLRKALTPGAAEFTSGCVTTAVAMALVMVSGLPSLQPLALVGYAFLAVACLFVIAGFRAFFALPNWWPAILSLGTTLAVTLSVLAGSGPHSFAARALIALGIAAAVFVIASISVLRLRTASDPTTRRAIIVGAAVAGATLLHIAADVPAAIVDQPGPAAEVAWNFALSAMWLLYMPILYLGVILMAHDRVIADLKTTIARDELTGALSRRAFIDLGERQFASCLARTRPATFLLLDLDYFKQINDRYGHAAGDAALGHFAGIVAACLAGRGTFGRIGGEEFGIVLSDHSEGEAFLLAEEIGRTVRDTPVGRFGQPIRLTVSIGIASASTGDTMTDVMVRADMALYASKADGRDRCTIAGRLQPDASARVLAAAAAQLRAAEDYSHAPQLLRDTG